jgi:Tol biopolymer transport system component
MRVYICGLCLMLLIPSTRDVFAQPGTEIYLFDMKVKKGKVFITNPKNITNRAGYDNQPFFHPDEPLLYYASADTSGRTDIIAYDYKHEVAKPFTHTAEREYSPTVTPDKQFVSCIVQRDNGVQDVCKYPVSGGEPAVVINSLKTGYHAWSDTHTLAIFVLGEPNTLRVYDTVTKKDSTIAQNVGRSLHRVPGGKGAISFVHKVTPGQWQIRQFTPGQSGITTLGEVPPGREDMAWTPDGGILISNDKQILYHAAATPWGWQTVDIQTGGELKTISRLAVSPRGDKIAVVINE